MLGAQFFSLTSIATIEQQYAISEATPIQLGSNPARSSRLSRW